MSMETVFRALADRNRRRLLDRLHGENGQTLGALCKGVAMTRQAVSKHLALLEAAHLITVRWEGREKRHFLNPVPIAEIGQRWISKYGSGRVGVLVELKRKLEKESS